MILTFNRLYPDRPMDNQRPAGTDKVERVDKPINSAESARIPQMLPYQRSPRLLYQVYDVTIRGYDRPHLKGSTIHCFYTRTSK